MTTGPDGRADRSALMERIGRSWDELQRAVDDLDEGRLTVAGPEGWSVKDHLAHLARWEQYLLAVLEGREARAVLGLEDGQERDEDAENAALQRRDAGLTAAEARRLLADAHASVVARLETLDDADLERRLRMIQGNTCDHFEEHRAWIGELLSAPS
jgi:uncharacterized damage-inducible protein DinB